MFSQVIVMFVDEIMFSEWTHVFTHDFFDFELIENEIMMQLMDKYTSPSLRVETSFAN